MCESGRQGCDALTVGQTLNNAYCQAQATTTAGSTSGGTNTGNSQSSSSGPNSGTSTTNTPSTTSQLPSGQASADCSNLPPFPDFCTYDECFDAKNLCLDYSRYCLAQYPDQNTQWYILPNLTNSGMHMLNRLVNKVDNNYIATI